MDFNLLLQLLKACDEFGVEYILFGGAALNLLGILRATQDADLFVRPDPDNIERLRQALRSVWNDPEIEHISTEDLCGDYPAVRYGPPTGDLTLDVVTRLGEAFQYHDLEFRTVNIKGVPVRLTSPRQLYQMKHATVRPQDRADAQALLEAFPQDFN